MRSKKQVSLAIRILREKRDASARATHLEAANEKYLLTTNERKQMSTTTNFKRIALVAVAALGLGVLSSVPSQASVPAANITLSATTGTVTAVKSDSSTAATVSINFLKNAAADSVSVTAGIKSKATGSTVAAITLMPLDTVGSTVALALSSPALGESGTASTITNNASGVAYLGAKYAVLIESATSTRTAGTYVVTVLVTPFENGVAVASNVKSIDVTITQAALATESTSASPATSTSLLSSVVGGAWQATATDSVLALSAKATGAAVAAVRVTLTNAAGTGSIIKDSLTVTIDKGNLGTTNSAAMGKSILVNYASGDAQKDIYVFGDGSSGVGNISISTLSAGTFTESLTWLGTDVKSIVAASYRSVIATGLEGSNGAVKVNAYDANSNSFGAGTAVYAYSSDTSVISDYGTACTWSSADSVAYCALTGVKAGTANITYRDAATVALSTVASNTVAVRVSAGTPSSFTLTTDKASYAPGEKGYLIITVKDSAGSVLPTLTASTTIFASGGITTNGQLGNSSDTMTGVAFTTARSSTPSSTDPIKVYTFYAPAAAGTVTFSAKGSSTLSAASQATATTATITVADNASAALAAVSALAVTVASLKTLITTLTNLVLKIQKKVKA
jgi:trimeric autotransporter adhesin